MNALGAAALELSWLSPGVASLTTLVNAIGQALLGEPPSPAMLNAILPALTATTDSNTRALNAVYLVAASSEYQVQR